MLFGYNLDKALWAMLSSYSANRKDLVYFIKTLPKEIIEDVIISINKQAHNTFEPIRKDFDVFPVLKYHYEIDIFSVLKTNRNIKLFNKLNDELKGDKLELSSENGMQEVFDLSSEINKKCHDIMVMETIYKEQLRSYEEAKEYEETDMSSKRFIVSKYYVETSKKQEDNLEQDIDNKGFQPTLRK